MRATTTWADLVDRKEDVSAFGRRNDDARVGRGGCGTRTDAEGTSEPGIQCWIKRDVRGVKEGHVDTESIDISNFDPPDALSNTQKA